LLVVKKPSISAYLVFVGSKEKFYFNNKWPASIKQFMVTSMARRRNKRFKKDRGKSSRLFAPIDGRLGLEDSTRTFDTVLSLVHFYSNYRYLREENRIEEFRKQI